MQKLFAASVLTLVFMSAGAAFAEDTPLSLTEAVRIAVTAADPVLLRFDARAEALEDRAVADAQLPDPTIRSMLTNFPTNSFRFEQEDMTQIQTGLRQEFPAGQTRTFRSARRHAEADVERARKELAQREIEQSVRIAWLDLFYWTKAGNLVRQSRGAVQEMIDALSAGFATGSLNAQDILRAELELSLLDDRLTEISRRAETARTDLARFIGPAAARPLVSTLPDFPTPSGIDEMEKALVHHPAVLVEEAQIAVADTEIKLAEEAYKPAWVLEGGYGLRGGGRADFASVGVTLSVPLFTGKRQDRRLSATIKEREAEKFDRAALLLALRRELGRAYVEWQHLGVRVDLYRNAVTQRANETAKASVSTYASGLTDFPELIRSQLAQLDAELKLAELHVEHAKAMAVLDYLRGDIQ